MDLDILERIQTFWISGWIAQLLTKFNRDAPDIRPCLISSIRPDMRLFCQIFDWIMDIQYLALMDIRLDIRQGNLVFGKILDIKKAQIIHHFPLSRFIQRYRIIHWRKKKPAAPLMVLARRGPFTD